MNVAVHTSRDRAWDETLEYLPEADVYHGSGYHRAAEANGEGVAHAFVAQDGDHVLFHPFLHRPIHWVGSEKVDGRWSDLESVYGYSGPLATTTDPTFLAEAWGAFHDWCQSEAVVAEFIRFDPLLENDVFAPADAMVSLDRETLALDLPTSADALWAAYPSVQRNMVRKAERANLEARVNGVGAELDAFRDLYAETMRRVRADPYYDFSDAYFAALSRLGKAARLVSVGRDQGLVASAVLLVAGERLHYHLSASTAEGRRLGANNLLLHEAAAWGIRRGLRVFHLGGGRTAARDDALLRFKASVGSRRLGFRTGRRVHNADAYADLCARWRRQASGRVAPPYFLLYRIPPDSVPA